MPSRPTRGRRKERRINVFVQEEAPKGRSAVTSNGAATAVAVDDEPGEDGAAGAAIATARSRRLRAQRTRNGRARSEVFTRTLGAEMRKFGILSGIIIAVLVVLTFVL